MRSPLQSCRKMSRNGTEFPSETPMTALDGRLWDVDEADRFFLLGGRPDLMTIEQQTLWKLLSEKLSSEEWLVQSSSVPRIME